MLRKYINHIKVVIENKEYEAYIDAPYLVEIKLKKDTYLTTNIENISPELENYYDGVIICGRTLCEINKKYEKVKKDFEEFIKQIIKCKE